MTWVAPPSLVRLTTLMAARRREVFGRRLQEDRSRIAENMAARGLLRSGAFHTAVHDAAFEAVGEFGAGLVADFIGLAADTNWDADVLAWLQERFSEAIDGISSGLAQSLTEGGSGFSAKTDEALSRRATEAVDGKCRTLKRDAEIEFGRVRLRRPTTTTIAPSTEHRSAERRDFFISFAGEDREAIARPLADAVLARGHSVWFADYELTIGDSLIRKINEGLRQSRFGVVILSPPFFRKAWPQLELDALAARAVAEGRKVILPVWHGVTHADVVQHSPLLGAVLAADSEKGVAHVADEVVRALKASGD